MTILTRDSLSEAVVDSLSPATSRLSSPLSNGRLANYEFHIAKAFVIFKILKEKNHNFAVLITALLTELCLPDEVRTRFFLASPVR